MLKTYLTKMREHERRGGTKAVIRLLIIGSSILGLVLFAAASGTLATQEEWNTLYFVDLGLLAFPLVWGIICPALTIRRQRPVHPGWAVAFDLLLWMGLLAMSITTLLIASITLYEAGDYSWYACSNSYTSGSSSSSSCSDSEEYTVKSATATAIFGGVVMAFLAFLELIVFVYACRDCERRDKKEVKDKAEKIIKDMVKHGELQPVGKKEVRDGIKRSVLRGAPDKDVDIELEDVPPQYASAVSDDRV